MNQEKLFYYDRKTNILFILTFIFYCDSCPHLSRNKRFKVPTVCRKKDRTVDSFPASVLI